MLPGFRLIAATFCFGFLVVFAGLRLATSVGDTAFPVMAAHAAPVAVAQLDGSPQAAPMMYDMRFAVSTMAKAPPLNVTALVIDRAAPLIDVASNVPQPQPETGMASVVPPADAAEPANPAETATAAPAAAVPAAQPDSP